MFKSKVLLLLALLGSTLFVGTTFSAEKCGKNTIEYTPPTEKYKQISQEKARKMENYISSDQTEASFLMESNSDKSENVKNMNTH